MKFNEDTGKILIIVGMHRSMTSLATNWLNKCGLHIGDSIFGAGTGNLKGHYEDIDFVQLHRYILKKNECSWHTVTEKAYKLDEYARLKSRCLIQLKNSLNEQWGWKDPRTCLFLDHWAGLLPEARFLIIYRSYPEVVDSLFRRRFRGGKKKQLTVYFQETAVKLLRGKKIMSEYLKLWIFYNRKILQFIEGVNKNRYLIIKNSSLLNDSNKIYQHLSDCWNFDLDYVPIDSIFDAKLTNKTGINTLAGLDESLLKEADQIQRRLDAQQNGDF